MGRPSVVVEPRCQASEFTLNERPFPMRWRKADLRGRVNGNLTLRFGHGGLTSYAGLEFVRRYFGARGLGWLLARRGGGAPARHALSGAPVVVAVSGLRGPGGPPA